MHTSFYSVTLVFALLFPSWCSAQVGVGTTTPNSNAILDASSLTRGLLIPRLALLSTTSSNPLSAHVAGMLVYNTATAGSGSTAVRPGVYYNDGTSWLALFSRANAVREGSFTCGLSTVNFTYNGNAVSYGTILSPTTGVCYLDRNLGAIQAAASMTDFKAYGDLFQWGRLADGHQLVDWSSSTSGRLVNGTTNTLSSSDIPGHNRFITSSAGPKDWRSTQNDNLWQGVNGINNPCPAGWFVPPTWEGETDIQNTTDAYNILKIPKSGIIYYNDINNGKISAGAVDTWLWSSSTTGTYANALLADDAGADALAPAFRALGFSVRCRR